MKIKEDFELFKLEEYGFTHDGYHYYEYKIYEIDTWDKDNYYKMAIAVNKRTREIFISQEIQAWNKDSLMEDAMAILDDYFKLPDVLLELMKEGIVE